MANGHDVVSPKQRDDLFNKLRDDPAFREAMKKDWKAAVKQVHVNPELVAKGALSRREIDDFVNQRAGWTIEIVIVNRFSGAETVQINEAVNFAPR